MNINMNYPYICFSACRFSLSLCASRKRKIPIERSAMKHEQQRTELELALDTEMPCEERISFTI